MHPAGNGAKNVFTCMHLIRVSTKADTTDNSTLITQSVIKQNEFEEEGMAISCCPEDNSNGLVPTGRATSDLAVELVSPWLPSPQTVP